MRRFFVALLIVGCAPASPPAYQWDLPTGFPVPLVPADNPMSDEKVELGHFLFYDTRMSGNGTYSCGSCHQEAHAFTDTLPVSMGSTGDMTPRGAMSLGLTPAASSSFARMIRSLVR